jgi:hypothetical protein
MYFKTDFLYPLLIGLVGLGIFLYHDAKVVTLVWSAFILVLILFEFLLGLHPIMQVIINYSFVLFASVTGSLIRYAYRMKNETLSLYSELEVSYRKLQAHANTRAF